MNSTEVQNPRCKLNVFGSVLACAKSDHVFQKLFYSLCGLCLSLFRHYNSSSDSNVSLRSQAPQQQYTMLSFSSMRRNGHSHKLHVHYGIALWAYLSEPLIKDSHKHLSSTEKPQYHVLQVTRSHVYRYIHVTERYTETLHMKKMADLVADSR